jgi:hypothetical protein
MTSATTTQTMTDMMEAYAKQLQQHLSDLMEFGAESAETNLENHLLLRTANLATNDEDVIHVEINLGDGSDDAKRETMFEIGRMTAKTGYVISIAVLVAEAWIAQYDEKDAFKPDRLRPAEMDNRQEVLIVSGLTVAATHDTEIYTISESNGVRTLTKRDRKSDLKSMSANRMLTWLMTSHRQTLQLMGKLG